MSSFGLPWRTPQEDKSEPSARSSKQRALQRKRAQSKWMSIALGLVKYLPALVFGFALGVIVRFPGGGDAGSGTAKRWEHQGSRARNKAIRLRSSGRASVGTNTMEISTSAESEELKMVFVVRQDLKMGGGKVASQCAHAAVGIYTQLVSRQRPLLARWEECGQPKIVVTCKNQQEMTDLKYKAEGAGLPTYTVADAGRTQVAAGSKTVLVIGPGPKDLVDSITRHLRLL